MDGSMLLPEFDHEFAETRRALERVPEDRFDWKPHEKSYSLHDLAAHVAEIPMWLTVTLETDVFDFEEEYERDVPETKEEILETFDAQLAAAREALAEASDDDLRETWTMTNGDETILSRPKAAVVRSFVLNHNIHHRAQLGVYLRLLDVPVPGHYGPTADEQM